MADNIFMRMMLNDKVKLEPAFLSKKYREEVLRRLKLRLEGVCSRHGYIKPNSIQLHKVCMGKVELISLNGNVVFDVFFYADICNPLIGSVVKSKVLNVNKFGILAEAEGVVEIIIAKNSVGIQSEIDLNKIRIGDEVLVEVVGKKFELNDKKISLIGRIVKDVKSNKQSNQSVIDESDEVDAEVEPEDDIQEGGEIEVEEEDEDKASDKEASDDDDDTEAASEAGSENEGSETGASDGDLEQELDGNFFSDEDEPMDGGDDADADADADEDAFDDDDSVASDD
jgi:DNA-directed RNA polymerase subunit E'/Rpb7